MTGRESRCSVPTSALPVDQAKIDKDNLAKLRATSRGPDAEDALSKAYDAGQITPDQYRRFTRESQMSDLQLQVEHLGPEAAVKGYLTGNLTRAQREEIEPQIRAKVARSELSADRRAALLDQIDAVSR